MTRFKRDVLRAAREAGAVDVVLTQSRHLKVRFAGPDGVRRIVIAATSPHNADDALRHIVQHIRRGISI